MRDALAKSRRPILFSICEWGSTKPWLWAANVGNMWRTTLDVKDIWDGKDRDRGVLQIVDMQDGLESYAGPGLWNNPDMLEVGNGGITDTEYRSHFSLWCLLAAPLIAGNDLEHMSDATKAILMNTELIAVDQDSAGAQAKRVRKTGGLEVWVKKMNGGSRAVGLLNRTESEAEITAQWADLGLSEQTQAAVRDLWAHETVSTRQGNYSAKVASHGTVVIKLCLQSR